MTPTEELLGLGLDGVVFWRSEPIWQSSRKKISPWNPVLEECWSAGGMTLGSFGRELLIW